MDLITVCLPWGLTMAHFQEQTLEAEKTLLLPKDSAEELLKASQNNRGLQKQTKNRWFASGVRKGTLRKLAKEETHCLKTQRKLLKAY